MKHLLYLILLVVVVWTAQNSIAHFNEPTPVKFWDNYGFRVGQTVIRTFVDDDPFNSLSRQDTLIVKDIRGGWILFSNGYSTRFGSFGMGLYKWEIVK